MQQKYEVHMCTKCGKNFRIKWIFYPTKLDDKRESYYNCPYCGNITRVYLKGNEDVETYKLE